MSQESTQPNGLDEENRMANACSQGSIGSVDGKVNEDVSDSEIDKTQTLVPSILTSSTKSIGIRRAEIMNKQYDTWTKKAFFYVSVFLVAYIYSVDVTIKNSLQAVITDSYSQHSLYSTINVVKGVIAAAAQPTYARLSDRFGRFELIIVSILLYVVGTIIESQAYDINRFAAGTAIHQVGYSGMIVLLQLAVADFSNLNWRLFCSLIPGLPLIINTWSTSEMYKAMYPKYSWNFCIGMFAFLFPISCIPLLICYLHMYLKARRTEEWKLVDQEYKEFHKSWWSTTKKLFWELDVIGILFIICVFGFTLVPLTLAGGVNASNLTGIEKPAEKWKQARIIAPLVTGIVLVPFFGIWEAKYSRFPIVPFKLLKDRGVWSAIIIGVAIDWVYYMPNDFLYTVLMVGMRASQEAATRITTLYGFVAVISGPLLGLVVTRFRRLKGFIIFGICCWIVALGLFVRYRGDNDGVDSQLYQSGVVGALCLMGFGAGFFTYPTQVSISTCTNHEFMGVVISLYLASYYIGMAVGSAVSGAVWTNIMYGHTMHHMVNLGVDTSLAAVAYKTPLTFIESYVWGTKERIAMVLAYAEVQRVMCIVGLVLCFPLLIAAFFLRDHKLESVQSLEKSQDLHPTDVREDITVLNDEDNAVVYSSIAKWFKKPFKPN